MSLLSKSPRLSTSSTSLRHSSYVAAGKPAASASSSFSFSVMAAKCHAPGREPTQFLRKTLLSGRGKAFDSVSLHACERLAHARAADHALRRDLRQRYQRERTLEQPRMRQRELRRVHAEIVVSEEIDVDRARSPSTFTGALTAQRPLDGLRPAEELVRGEVRFHRNAKVYKRVLILDTPGRSAVVRGAGKQANIAGLAQQCDCAVEGTAGIADVAAQPQERLSHACGGRA